MKPKGTHDLSEPIRAVIIAFRVFFKLPWVEISQKLGVPANSAQNFFQRTQNLTKGSLDFYELLAVSAPKNRSHRKPIIAPSSAESHKIRSSVLTHKNWHRTDAVNYDRRKINCEPLKDTTILNCCLDPIYTKLDLYHPRPITQRHRPRKIELSKDNKDNRLAYYNTLLSITGVLYELTERLG